MTTISRRDRITIATMSGVVLQEQETGWAVTEEDIPPEDGVGSGDDERELELGPGSTEGEEEEQEEVDEEVVGRTKAIME